MPNYELLDSSMLIEGRRYRGRQWGDDTTDPVPGDEIELDQEQGDRLEAMGSVRPEGVDDHNLVDDERDLPALMASPQGRADIAARRMGKRKPPNRKAGQPSGHGEARTAPGRAADQVTEAVTGQGGDREKSGGRRS